VKKHETACQSLDNLLAILGATAPKYFPVNAVADIPVQLGQFRVDANGNSLSCRCYQCRYLVEEPVYGIIDKTDTRRCSCQNSIFRFGLHAASVR
jgi:hypothetical protein